jgi:HPt (histidine-containing phosphotransfer) domain-containing protein
MDGKIKPAQHSRTGRFTRAAARLQQFFTRALTPVDNPLTAAPEVPELPKDSQVPRGRRHSFSGEIFAELLTELPVHRRQISRAWEAGDLDTLRSTVHKLLGAVSYCDAPELEDALRELRLALKTEEQHTIEIYHERAINVINSTLRYSGYRG